MKGNQAIAVMTSALMLTGSFSSVHAANKVDELLSKMTTEQKLAQMVVIKVSKYNNQRFTSMNDEIKNLISTYDFGGIMLDENNLDNTKQTVELTKSIQQAAMSGNAKIPMMIAVKNQGGNETVLKEGSALPGSQAIGASQSTKTAEDAGKLMADELSAMGINANFAPNANVSGAMSSFSDDPQLVSKMAIAMSKGLNDGHVASCVTEFPGTGSASQTQVVNKSQAELEKSDFVPYKAIASKNVDMISLGNASYPNVDSTKIATSTRGYVYPQASFSSKIVTDLLRTSYKYQGVIASDDLSSYTSMTGLMACRNAINAGCDYLVTPITIDGSGNLNRMKSLMTNLVAKVNSKDIDINKVNASVRRILQMKQTRKILDYKADDLTVDHAQKIVASKDHRDREEEITSQGVTAVKNNKVLPLKNKKNILFLTPYSNEATAIDYAMKDLSNSVAKNVKYSTMIYNASTNEASLTQKIKQVDAVIVVSEITQLSRLSQSQFQTSVPKKALEIAKNNQKTSVAFSIGIPYDLAQLGDADAIVAVYGNKGMDHFNTPSTSQAYGPNIVVGVKSLFGAYKINGHLPVNDYSYSNTTHLLTSMIAYKRGTGLTINAVIKSRNQVDDRQKKQTYTPQQQRYVDVAEAKQSKVLAITVIFSMVFGLVFVLVILKLSA